MDKKRLPGRVTISVLRGNRDEPYIRMSVEDENSGAHFIEVEMGMQEFAQCITGQGYIHCEFILRKTELLGLKREHKTEMVAIPNLLGMEDVLRDRTIKDHLAPYETEGWCGRVSDALNWHNRIRGDGFMETFKISFVRYVEMSEQEENSPAAEAHASGPFVRPNGKK